MIITDEKIKVTWQMLQAANMTQFGKIGVPNPEGGLIWKAPEDLEENDFDAIEEYFLKKQGYELGA
jgi:hypothetical protein